MNAKIMTIMFSVLVTMVRLTIEQKSEIIALSRHHSNRETAQIFNERHPDRLPPLNQRTVGKLQKKLLKTGTLKQMRKRSERNLAESRVLEDNVRDIFINRPHTSVRNASLHVNKSHMTVQKILKKAKYRAYKMSIHQKLLANDYQKRLQFGLTLMERIAADDTFQRKILWSDECLFKLSGCFNRQNYR